MNRTSESDRRVGRKVAEYVAEAREEGYAEGLKDGIRECQDEAVQPGSIEKAPATARLEVLEAVDGPTKRAWTYLSCIIGHCGQLERDLVSAAMSEIEELRALLEKKEAGNDG